MDTKPTKKLHRSHIIGGVTDGKCLVCSSDLLLQKTDGPSEARCMVCGAVYTNGENPYPTSWLADYLRTRPEKVSRTHLRNFPYLPVYEMYWNQRKSLLPLGRFTISTVPYSREQELDFYAWVLENKARLSDMGYAQDFNWESIASLFGS